MKYKIIPAILEADDTMLRSKLSLTTSFSDTVHVDIIDESFSETPCPVRPTSLTPFSHSLLELHLMVHNPEELIEMYSEAGAKRFVGHVETIQNIPLFCSIVQKYGGEVFLGIDLPTEIGPFLSLDIKSLSIKGFTILTVKAGKSGQKFQETALEKVKTLRHSFPETTIEVDGGITPGAVVKAKEAGANLFCANSFLFNEGNPRDQFNKLTSLL